MLSSQKWPWKRAAEEDDIDPTVVRSTLVFQKGTLTNNTGKWKYKEKVKKEHTYQESKKESL